MHERCLKNVFVGINSLNTYSNYCLVEIHLRGEQRQLERLHPEGAGGVGHRGGRQGRSGYFPALGQD